MPRTIAQAAAAGSDNWVVSETTSPVDYSPVVVATTLSRVGSDSATMQLSIHCRGGRTELVVTGPAVSRSAEEYLISYRVNDDPPCSFPLLAHRSELAPRSGATSCACCSRSLTTANSPYVFPREQVWRRRDISCLAA